CTPAPALRRTSASTARSATARRRLSSTTPPATPSAPSARSSSTRTTSTRVQSGATSPTTAAARTATPAASAPPATPSSPPSSPPMSVPDAEAASDKTLVDGFRGIADMADRLGLVATIRDLAKETFKKLDEAKGCPRGRKRDSVYAACRNLGMPRTYKQLASVTAGGVAAKKDVGKMATHIKKLLGEEDGQVMDIGVVSASDYLRRFCSRLGLGNQEVRNAQDAVRRVEEGLDVRRNPDSVAAAIIYMVVQLSVATGVAEGTIKEVHKDLTPHAQMLFG
ncbi:hypothetical protein CFC21_008054, partial [Triticum aestivum]